MIFDTICDSTEKRQAEVKETAKNVDAVIVVGGKNSGNTQRLAEVAREAGAAAFHIETESELDIKALSKAENICITAGASTPNWIIRNVYNAIENSVQITDSPGWIKKLRKILRTALLSNAFLAAGAAFLCMAASSLQESGFFMLPAVKSGLYVFSMQVFNQIITKTESDLCNVSEKTEFYMRHRLLMITAGIISAASCLILSLSMSVFHFILILTMSILGIFYSVRILPEGLWGKYRRIKDIPGSKSVLTAAAWAILTTVLPASGSVSVRSIPAVLLTFFWVSGMVFIRNAIFDTLDMQGDKISGKETIPILIGEEKTIRMLSMLFAFTTVLPLAGAASGMLSSAGFLLWLPPAALACLTWMQRNRKIDSDQKFEFIVESNFIVSGIIGALWMMVYG
jgi:4-hydroxy-3-methylbut-2-enyl diphosphate reductase